jgi:predicted ATPase with chaperone activity
LVERGGGRIYYRRRAPARGYHWALRVGRTVADLVGAETVQRTHIAEALDY